MNHLSSLKSFLWQWRGVWISTPLVSLVIIISRYFGLFQPLDLFAFDVFFQLKSPEDRDERIAIVGIGEEDVEKIGTALISDEIYAIVLEKLLKQQPVAVGLDVYRDVPMPPGTDELNQTFRSHSNIIGIEKMIGDSRQFRVKPSPVLKEKNQIGFNDVMLDYDNKVRRALLALPDRKAFSLSMYLALLYLQKQNINLTTYEEGENRYFQLKDTVFIPLKSNHGGYSNVDDGGIQMLLNYRGNVNHFETVSLFDIIDEKVPMDWAKDRIILIGFIGESFQDVHPTPYTKTASQRMSGVEIHANIISQVISNVLDERPFLQVWTKTQENLWIILWTGIGAVMTWHFRKTTNLRQGIIVFCGVVTLFFTITYGAFLLHWWIPLFPPLVGFLSVSGSITIYTARNAAQIRHTFGRYLSDEIVNILLESPEGVKLGGERRTITILTSDLRGFTAVSEQLPPEEVVRILNFYLGYMANIIADYQGTIDEFMGDGILVLFGAPITRKDDADRAVACAIAMQLAMEEINQQVKEWGYSPLKMGIGINTGEVVVGNIGSEKRTKYAIVGNEVNLTYRIESYTKGREILISEKTLESLKAKVDVAEEKKVSPKGVKKPINIYKIIGIEGKYSLTLPEIPEQVIPLENTIDVNFCPLNDKDVTNEYYLGKIVTIFVKDIEKGAEIKLENSKSFQPNPLDNLKLNFLTNPYGEAIYGKVISVDNYDSSFKIYFTYLPIWAEKKIAEILAFLP